jgi:hypothetical protein
MNGKEPAGQTKTKIAKKSQSLNGNDGWPYVSAHVHAGQCYGDAEDSSAEISAGPNR